MDTSTRNGARFLEALSSRDYEALGACFAVDATPELGWNAYEQTAYAEATDGVIVQMRLACSGHRPL